MASEEKGLGPLGDIPAGIRSSIFTPRDRFESARLFVLAATEGVETAEVVSRSLVRFGREEASGFHDESCVEFGSKSPFRFISKEIARLLGSVDWADKLNVSGAKKNFLL